MSTPTTLPPDAPLSPAEKVFEDIKPFLPDDVKIYGPDSADKATGLRRITWEPDRVDHVPAERLGGGAGHPGSLWVRNFRMKVTVWDETFAATEVLLAHLVDALHRRLTHNGYRLDGEEWSSGRVATRGFDVVIWVVLRVPFVRLEPTFITIERFRGEAHVGPGSSGVQVPIVVPPDPSP